MSRVTGCTCCQGGVHGLGTTYTADQLLAASDDPADVAAGGAVVKGSAGASGFWFSVLTGVLLLGVYHVVTK